MKNRLNILFVIESLTLAGSEKSLVALLSNLDSNKYNVDLQLIKYGGELEKSLPDYVNILPPLAYVQFTFQPWKDNIKQAISGYKPLFLKAKIWFSIGLRMRKRNHTEIAKLYWETSKSTFKMSEKEYDVAIAFAQGLPTFYVMDKIKANKKVTWVNTNVRFTKHNMDFQKEYYKDFDKIVAISEGTKNHLNTIFPHLSHKFKVIPNIIDLKSILKMSDLYEAPWDKDNYNILTVGRLDNRMKGMDITIETCKLLRDKGLSFHWTIVGEGTFREEMENYIKNHKLENHLSLLGATDNPYPYFKAADLYVQTSRSEGYGRTIAEARLLNLPIVTTRFDTVFMQMVDGKNGMVAEMNPEAVADAIELIMKDKALYSSVKNYLKQENKGNDDSVKKFDTMINDLFSAKNSL